MEEVLRLLHRARLGAPAFLDGLLVAGCAAFLLGPFLVLCLGVWCRGEWSGLDLAHQVLPRPALLWATVRITCGAALLATVLGTVMALAIRRARGAWRTVLAAAYPMPLLLPAVVVAISWTHLLGKRGVAAQAWQALGWGPELPFSVYGEAGSAAVLACCWYPLVTMALLVGLRAVGTRAVAAGRLYAGPWRRVWRIDLPLLAPYFSIGAACVAWLSLGDFDVPCVFLRAAFPLEIYAALQSQPDVGRALATSLPLLGLGLGILVLREWAARAGSVPTLDTCWQAARAAHAGAPAPNALLQAAAAGILLLTVALPVAALAHQAGSWPQVQAALGTARAHILNSFLVAAMAVGVLLAAGFPYARVLRQAGGQRRMALAALALFPLLLPATLHGLAWTAALNGSEPGRWVLDSPLALSLAAAARFFPLVVFILAAAGAGVDPRLAAAARVCGASSWTTFRRIVWPLTYPAVLTAATFGWAFALGELGASVLLQPPGWGTLPIRISSLLHFGKDELVAALCLVQVFLAWIPYLAAAAAMEHFLEADLG